MTEKWQNKALLNEASAIFIFRYIPHLTLTTDMAIECNGIRYNILSIENIRGKNMYYEVATKKEVTPVDSDTPITR